MVATRTQKIMMAAVGGLLGGTLAVGGFTAATAGAAEPGVRPATTVAPAGDKLGIGSAPLGAVPVSAPSTAPGSPQAAPVAQAPGGGADVPGAGQSGPPGGPGGSGEPSGHPGGSTDPGHQDPGHPGEPTNPGPFPPPIDPPGVPTNPGPFPPLPPVPPIDPPGVPQHDPDPVVRDHRGDNPGGGGVTVENTPVDPIVRDHRTDPVVRDHRS